MRRIITSLLALTLTSSALIGCSKKDDASNATKAAVDGSAGILAEPLLMKLPPSTEAFYLVNASGDAYKKMQASPWGDGSTGLGSLQKAIDQLTEAGADPVQIASLQVILSTLQNLGLVAPDGRSVVDEVLNKAVFFAAVSDNDAQPVDAGVYFAGAKGVSLKAKLPVLRQLLGDADMLVSDEKIGGVDGLVARPPRQPDDATQEVALYLAATDSLMAISLSRASAESLFASTNTDTVKLMADSPQFKKAVGSVGASPSSIAFGYMDVKKLVPVLDKLMAANPDLQDERAAFNELPVDGVAVAQNYDREMVSALGVAVSSRSSDQSKLLSALEGASLPTSLAKLPSDTAVALGLDTSFVGKLGDLAASLQEDPQGAALLQRAKELQGFTLGLRSGDGTSPVPDIYLVFNAADRDTFSSGLQDMLGQLMAEGMGAAPQWQEKDIDGSPTRFITTMIGAGIFMSSPKNSNAVVIASSERAMRDVLATSSGKSSGIADSLQASLKESLAASKLASVYFNAIQTAKFVDSMKPTLAMFGAQSPELDEAMNTENLKRFGRATGSISYSDGLFLVESAIDASGAAAR